MPWQADRDPYKVWLSEVMLQQTRVVTATEYFRKFLEQFPSVTMLAAAPAESVMALWSGLGYYSRARNLHACAKIVAEKHAGVFPRSAAELTTLPGIGPSTAAAIASISFGERISIYDGNVKRVVARISGYEEDLSRAANDRALYGIAQSFVPEGTVHMPRHTQGLMDLGATVCTPKKPSCSVCPFERDCASRALGRELSVPVNTRKLLRKRMDSHWLWLKSVSPEDGAEMVWLQQRPPTGVWGALWSLPTLDAAEVDQLAMRHGWDDWIGSSPPERLETIKHVLTHRDWYLTPVVYTLDASQAAALDDSEILTPGKWLKVSDVRNSSFIGIPSPLAKLLQGE